MRLVIVLLIWAISSTHFGFRLHRLKQADAYHAAIEALSNRPEVHAAAGGPLKVGPFPRGGVALGSDTAAYTVKARGSYGSTRARVVLESFDSRWRLIRITLRAGPEQERVVFAENVERLRKGKVHAATAYGLLVNGKHQEAIAEFDLALRADPLNTQSLRWRGFAHEIVGDHRRAEMDYRRLIEISPLDAEAHLRLGIQYGRGGNYRRGEELINRAIELDPGQGIAFFARAVLRERSGRPGDAAKDLERACELNYREACAALRTKIP